METVETPRAKSSLGNLRRGIQYANLLRNSVAARYGLSQTIRDRARRHLVERLGRMKGLPQKFGQMLSFSANESNKDWTADFQSLQDAAEPLAWDDICAVLERYWGPQRNWAARHFDPVGKAASIGQVHRASLVNGSAVAVKIQYPEIAQAITADLSALGWSSVPLQAKHSEFDFSGYREALHRMLQCELDYTKEAANQQKVARWIASDEVLSKSIIVPEVIPQISGRHVIVSRWEDGEAWSQVVTEWPEAARRQLAQTLLRCFLRGVFQQGSMQADWHPGNFRFRRNGSNVQLVMYDFGCLITLTEEQKAVLARLILATMHETESPLPLLIQLGFNEELLGPMEHRLPALCRTLFEPFCVEGAFDLRTWRLKDRVSDVLGDDRWNFRLAGPPPLVYLVRAFHGLIYYLTELGMPIAWRREFEDIAEALRPSCQQVVLPQLTSASSSFDTMAKKLVIQVHEGGRKKVQLTFHASRIDHLNELIDDDIKAKLQSRNIEVEELVSSVRRRQYAPGTVFQLEEDGKTVQVSLE